MKTVYFNPRPHEEGDGTLEECREWCRISIHALMKRATVIFAVFLSDNGISIHALMKRATDTSKAVTQSTEISIHALMKRATEMA